MKTILISFIGKGPTDEKANGYIKTQYKFDERYISEETAFFGSALFRYLRLKGHDIDKWLIFGTGQSSWSEIVASIDYTLQEKIEDLYLKVYEERDGISDVTLNEWQECLGKYIRGICLVKVDPLDYKIYANKLLELLPDDEIKIVFDMTHAFRHMTALMAFSLMYVSCFKNFNGIDVYYGAFEMGDKYIKPAVKIDFINQLFSLTTSYEVYRNSGYFPPLLKNMGIDNSEKTYFKLEMNRSPRKEINDLINKIQSLEDNDGYIKKAALSVEKEFYTMNNLKCLDQRMLERAKFFYEKKQYLIAMTLLYEAILDKAARVYNIKRKLNEERNDYNSRVKKETKNKLKNIDIKLLATFNNLEYARNSAVHGEPPNSTQNFLEVQGDFERLFFDSIKVYDIL
ncbi:TIGR02221 family CRISPR-associated protein [Thermoanaerobacterium sp. RBIITD]|uniref:TIGR02221 family CRISPR-associated protein n=1 Tax=Thermoanaerobacterium sp. RBIITD TaxID=1550240 RepID=UPI000BB68A8A|nr:TIGR02221 family CRISPR-associated protein [Thermoanaerobacterium sp. RBIITD]SNX53617.1 CRISPR-associated protein, TM1812 family [Thermoanaerobacterium sp. RBIITD]